MWGEDQAKEEENQFPLHWTSFLCSFPFPPHSDTQLLIMSYASSPHYSSLGGSLQSSLLTPTESPGCATCPGDHATADSSSALAGYHLDSVSLDFPAFAGFCYFNIPLQMCVFLSSLSLPGDQTAPFAPRLMLNMFLHLSLAFLQMSLLCSSSPN